jgi:hypothetical protein
MRSIAIFHSAPTFASLSAQQQIGNSFFLLFFSSGRPSSSSNFHPPTKRNGRSCHLFIYLSARVAREVTNSSRPIPTVCCCFALIWLKWFYFWIVFAGLLISFWVVWPNDKYTEKKGVDISTSCAWCYKHIFSAFSKFSRESSPCVGYSRIATTYAGWSSVGTGIKWNFLFFYFARGQRNVTSTDEGTVTADNFFLFSCVYFFFFCRK